MKGKINRLVRKKGFGFIEAEKGGVFFFHNSSLEGIDFNAVKMVYRVEFNLKKRLSGTRAENIRIIES